MQLNKINILYDYREKFPWKFVSGKIKTSLIKTKLLTGDYQLADSNSIVIEKKGNISELLHNFSSKNIDLFSREIRLMQDFEKRLIICSFTKEQLSQRLLMSNNQYEISMYWRILSELSLFEDMYKVKTIWARSDKEAELYALNFLKLSANKVYQF